MKTNYKHSFFSALILCGTFSLAAQGISYSGYFMENATHRHLFNPALTPKNAYISLPVVGAFSLGLQSNMVLSNYLYPSATGDELLTFMHPDINADQFLSKLSPMNYMQMNLRTELLSFGLYTGGGFLSFGVDTRVDIEADIPKDFFAFAKKGMSNGSGTAYDIKNFLIGADGFAEVSLGYSRDLFENLRVGVNLKGLVGLASFRAKIDQMDVRMSPDEWLVQTKASVSARLQGARFEKDEQGKMSGLAFGTPGIGGMGAALDLGFSYMPIPNLTFSAGLLDLGSIRWKKESILNASSEGTVRFAGLEGISTDGTADIETQVNQLKDDLLSMADLKEQTVQGAISTGLDPTLNLGLEYSVWKDRISAGLLYSRCYRENFKDKTLMASLNIRPIRLLQISGTYSFLHDGAEKVGFALNFYPYILNLFLACDYVFWDVTPQYIPINTSTMNVQLGVSIPLGKKPTPKKAMKRIPYLLDSGEGILEKIAKKEMSFSDIFSKGTKE